MIFIRKENNMEKIKLFLLKFWNGECNPHLFIIAMVILLILSSCKTSKTVSDIDHKTDSVKIEYREYITLKDTTVYIPIPYERVVNIVPHLDTLKLDCSVASSMAWLDTCTNTLKGSLTTKENAIKTNIPTTTKTIINDSIIYKDHYINKTVEKPYIPAWYSKTCGLLILIAFVIGLILGYKKRDS